MLAEGKIRIVADEDEEVVAQLDEKARNEGTTRSALIRRGIRLVLFSSPSILQSDTLSLDTTTAEAA